MGQQGPRPVLIFSLIEHKALHTSDFIRLIAKTIISMWWALQSISRPVSIRPFFCNSRIVAPSKDICFRFVVEPIVPVLICLQCAQNYLCPIEDTEDIIHFQFQEFLHILSLPFCGGLDSTEEKNSHGWMVAHLSSQQYRRAPSNMLNRCEIEQRYTSSSSSSTRVPTQYNICKRTPGCLQSANEIAE